MSFKKKKKTEHIYMANDREPQSMTNIRIVQACFRKATYVGWAEFRYLSI